MVGPRVVEPARLPRKRRRALWQAVIIAGVFSALAAVSFAAIAKGHVLSSPLGDLVLAVSSSLVASLNWHLAGQAWRRRWDP